MRHHLSFDKKRLLAVLLGVTGLCGSASAATTEKWQAAIRMGLESRERGELNQAALYFSEALTEAEILPPLDERLALTLNALATAYLDLGKVEEACPLVRRAASALETLGTKQGLAFAVVLNSEAACSKLRGQTTKAETHFRNSLVTCPEVPRCAAPRFASLNGLGTIRMELADFGEAERYFRDAFELARSGAAGNARLRAAALNNLGTACYRSGKADDATASWREAISILESEGLARTETFGSVANNLAVQLAITHKYAEADAMFRKAIMVFEQERLPASERALRSYAQLLRRMKRRAESKTVLERAKMAHEEFHVSNGANAYAANTIDFAALTRRQSR